MVNPSKRWGIRALLPLAVPLVAALGCSTSTDKIASPGVPADVESIIFLQRVARNEGMGNVFDYTGYSPGGRIVKLSPPAPNGQLTVLTANPMFADADFMSWDLSFDARVLVFSARLKSAKNYHLFTMNVDGTQPHQLTEGPYDYVYPVFIPGQKILFTTSKSVEADAKQFQDEYERQTTAQVGVVNIDGSREDLGPRNVSHRVAPAVMPDGTVLYTEWRHLGEVNDGHLRFMNSDMTRMREAFGGEGKGLTNSYLKARYVATAKTAGGADSFRIVTVGTSRDRTLQSGKLLLVDLNQTEKAAEVRDLTPEVPGDRVPSVNGAGRYYDAEPIGDPKDLKLLVSWADGPVETEVLEKAKTRANFGVYLFVPGEPGRPGKRFPIYDSPDYWDVMARPVKPRLEPVAAATPQAAATDGNRSFTLGAVDVYKSTVFKNLEPGSIIKVRLLEGFSSEEGFPNMFGLTEFDGQSRLGEVDLQADGSFAAKVPPNVPIHMQLVDKFGMSAASEDIWLSGRAGEQRFCGGCHEDRAKAVVLPPGSTQAISLGAVDLDRGLARKDRLSMDFSYDKIRGVPWDLAIAPILTKKCAACHDGNPDKVMNGKIVNPSYTVVDKTLGTTQTFVFDLTAKNVAFMVGERRMYDYPASYVSLAGIDMSFGENQITITNIKGNRPPADMAGGKYNTGYIRPGHARESELVRRLNPPQRFPQVDAKIRAFMGGSHPVDVGAEDLTAEEHYRIILNIDMGAQFHFRENRRVLGPDMMYVPK